MKILKNKIVVAAICFVVAGLIAFIIVPSQKKPDGAVEVIKVSENILANTKITEDMLKEVAVSSDSVPDTALQDKKDIVGKYAKVNLYTEDFIVDEKLSSINMENKLYDLEEGEKAISITPKTLSKSVSGNLLIGDVVQIYGYDTQNKQMNPNSGKWYFEVVAIDNSKSENVSGADLESTSDIVPAAITIKVNSDEQIQSIVEMEMNNDIQVVFAGRGETAKKLLY